MQGISRRSVRCLANSGQETLRHSGCGQLPLLPSSSLQVRRLMCVLQSKRAIRGEMFARGWETSPDRTSQYFYKLPTSSPMSYPKCEMEFPYWHFKSTGVRGALGEQGSPILLSRPLPGQVDLTETNHPAFLERRFFDPLVTSIGQKLRYFGSLLLHSSIVTQG